MKELGEKTVVSVGLDLPSAGGETEAGVRSPHCGSCPSQRRNIKAESETAICGSLNGMRIIRSLPQPYIPQTETLVSWKGQWLGAGV